MPERDDQRSEASILIRKVAGRCFNRKQALRRLGRMFPDWSPNRLEDVWEADHRIIIKESELSELRAAAAMRVLDGPQFHDGVSNNDKLLADLQSRIIRLERSLAKANQELAGQKAPANRYRDGQDM